MTRSTQTTDAQRTREAKILYLGVGIGLTVGLMVAYKTKVNHQLVGADLYEHAEKGIKFLRVTARNGHVRDYLWTDAPK